MVAGTSSLGHAYMPAPTWLVRLSEPPPRIGTSRSRRGITALQSDIVGGATAPHRWIRSSFDLEEAMW